MINPDSLKEKLTPFLESKEADRISIAFFRSRIQASRFANSIIHQHMSDEDQSIYIRVLQDGRLGTASTNSLDKQSLTDAFTKALHIARIRLEIKQKKTLPSFKAIRPLSGFYHPDSAHMQPRSRVKILRKIFSEADSLKIKFAGNLYNGLTQLAVLSSGGTMNYQDYSLAGIKLIAVLGDSSGYAGGAGYNIESLDCHALSDTAARKCLRGLKKTTLKPGRYDVILEPAAVAELILWLNYTGFGAKSVFEETSFLYNKCGRRIAAKGVNIYDSGSDRNTFILPFDFEGLLRRKTYLIKNGIAGRPLCDSHYARLLRTRPSGHANFPDDTDGPLGYNLVMGNGDTTQDKMIQSAKEAILITRFHYINGFLDTHRALMTGMTRDGTFLVRDGEIASAIRDMRFTDSILEAFARISGISRQRQLIADHLEAPGSVYAPSLYIKDFNFTS